jgi:anti-anti-sigma factor
MFSMDLDPGSSAGLTIVTLRGELDLVHAADVAIALAATAARDRWIIVNLAGLDFIDAAGVKALSRGRRFARNAGGGLLLAAPHGIVQRVLTLIWDADGPIKASVAAAAASAEILRARSHAGPAAALRPPAAAEGAAEVAALCRYLAPGAPARRTVLNSTRKLTVSRLATSDCRDRQLGWSADH